MTTSQKPDLNSSMDDPLLDAGLPPPKKNPIEAFIYNFPWWAAVLAGVGVWVVISIAADPIYSNIYRQLQAGIEMTLRITVVSYSGALFIGLMIGLIRSYPPQPQQGLIKRIYSLLHLFFYHLATLLLELARGLPILTMLLIFAFVIIPAIKDYMAFTYDIVIEFRGTSVETAMIVLAVVYGAFLSEIFRAGIQSVDRGQVEAAKSLGMTNFQTMRLVVLPQAIRRVLPPMGNDFISMIKDTSLISIYGIREVTQIARVSSGSSFRYLETYLVAAAIYLALTIIGSILVRTLEQRMKQQ